jgi:PQQ-dependent dehydrogenase (methanol/ethanol family)
LKLAGLALLGLASPVLMSAKPLPRQTGQIDLEEWSQHGRTPFEQRFSPLVQINTETIERLGLAWSHELDTDRGQEATPIFVDGVLYVSTAWSKVYAFDAKTGQQLWKFDPNVARKTLGKACCDAVNRGVAVADGRVLIGTLDGRLIALDAKSGAQIWSTVTVDQAKAYTITGAPRIIRSLVLIGNGGAEYGVRGYISAYDTANGKLVWRFYTVPNPTGKADHQPSDKPLRQLAAKSWFGDFWKRSGGGGTVWDAMAYDPDADLLYFGVGNGSPWNYKIRSDGKGDNLFLSSIVAVRPLTGKYVWHYQTTPGDSWDFTATQQITLADITIDGAPRKVLFQAPKNGFFYVIDRITGKLISAKPYAEVNWATQVDLKTGRPVVVPEARYFEQPWLTKPSALGAHSWHPMSYSPQTGLIYIPAQHFPGRMEQPASFVYREGHLNLGLATTGRPLPTDPEALRKLREQFFGALVAWDPISQAARWTVKHQYFLNGGVLSTAGNLVFQGTSEGKFIAYVSDTGRQLWSYTAQSGIIAPPISYAINGKQYIALLAGYGGIGAMVGTFVPYAKRVPGQLLVFALDGSASAPIYQAATFKAPDLEGVSSAGDAARGAVLYGENCMSCHGAGASDAFTADLRRSSVLRSAPLWRSIVIDGAFERKGMVGFAKYITLKDAEDIRSYVIDRAKLIIK